MFERTPKRQYAVDSLKFYLQIGGLFIGVLFFKWLLPEAIPFGIFDFWYFAWDWAKLAQIPWPLLLFGPVLTLLGAIFTKKSFWANREQVDEFGTDLRRSVLAGIFEEMRFRWIGFFYAIVTFYGNQVVIDWLSQNSVFDWMKTHWFLVGLGLVVINVLGLLSMALLQDKSIRGCMLISIAFGLMATMVVVDLALLAPLTKWWYTTWAIPTANWICQGRLSLQLGDFGWTVAAALLSVNWKFGEGHGYQGCIGWANSWVIGMLMFWIMFNFGLPVAMLIHAVYDIAIDLIRYTDARIELAARSR